MVKFNMKLDRAVSYVLRDNKNFNLYTSYYHQLQLFERNKFSEVNKIKSRRNIEVILTQKKEFIPKTFPEKTNPNPVIDPPERQRFTDYVPPPEIHRQEIV